VIQYPLEVAGVMTRVLERGDRSDPSVLLIHGVGSRADRWRKNVDALAEAGYHVAALDLPGHGFAAKGAGFDYSIAGYAAFVESYLDAEGIDRVALVGTSMGGHIAGLVTCERRGRISALALVGSIGLVPWGDERRAGSRARMGNTSREGVMRKLGVLLHDPSLVDAALVEEEWRINNSPGAAATFAALAEYFGERLDDDVVGPRLAQVTGVPVLLVWGAEDLAVPVEMGYAAHALLPGSELVVIPETAHAPYYERPDEFNSSLLGFLEKVVAH
jgi:pimeloyl-ACP methyl ester carboxylesterase